MKKAIASILLITLFTVNISFAQDQDSTNSENSEKSLLIFGKATFGKGVGGHGNGILSGEFSANVILKNNVYLSLSYNLGLGGKRTIPNNSILYGLKSVRVGLSSDVSEHFRIIPSIGVGFQNLLRTTYRFDEELNALNQTASAVAGFVGQEITYQDRYLTESLSVLVIPVGVDFYLQGKSVGFVIGGYMNISKYSELGLRLGLSFGKLK